MTIIQEEAAYQYRSLTGRKFSVVANDAGIIRNQKISVSRPILYDGEKCTIRVQIRLDDECNNGHESFSITGDIFKGSVHTDRGFIRGGCIHEHIIKYMPEFRAFFRDFDTLPSTTTKLLFMQDNAAKMQRILDVMHELNKGVISCE